MLAMGASRLLSCKNVRAIRNLCEWAHEHGGAFAEQRRVETSLLRQLRAFHGWVPLGDLRPAAALQTSDVWHRRYPRRATTNEMAEPGRMLEATKLWPKPFVKSAKSWPKLTPD